MKDAPTKKTFIKIIKNFGKSALVWMGVTWIMIIAASYAGLHAIHLSGQDWSKISVSHSLIFFLIRVSIIMVIAYFWPLFCRLLGKRSEMPKDKIDYLISKRWKIVLLLMIIELLLCENLIVNVIHIIRSL